ncbi:MAG: 30S ribosomal protein S1 [Deltaproteobacteria bacterium]|nr:30S ribosomal protein S1 [Deltaproteobacteria bacterium]
MTDQEKTGKMEMTEENQTGETGEENFAELFESSYSTRMQFQEGSIVKGVVLKIEEDKKDSSGGKVWVDIGYKSEGIIRLYEFKDVDGNINVKEGDNIEVFLESCEDETGSCKVSKEKADRLKIWHEIGKAYEDEEIIEGTIVSRVKGGLSVDIGVKAFLPGSQVDTRPVRNLEKLIGEKRNFKIIKFNKKRGNIVLSHRALKEEEEKAKKKATLERLEEGAVLKGRVKNITEYGAFVDLGGIDGLLHITDMSWGRVNHPKDVVEEEQEVDVKVLKFDPDSERVSLGIKQLTVDPWELVPERYKPGTKVKGQVVSLADYGAFIELEEGVEGLVHVSEMSWTRRVKHPSKVVAIGDTIEAVVLDLDNDNRRISLGMKQVEPNPWTLLTSKYPVGSIIRGRIRNITDFGIFIGIEEGIDGLVHISDISWTYRVKHPGELFTKGEEVEAVVLNIDVENERFSLGIKQLTDDPWDSIPQKYPIGRVVTCKVLKVGDYGAFVELERGIEGIIEPQDLSQNKSDDEKGVVKAGDYITAEILAADRGERRIALSAKGIAEGEKVKEYLESKSGDSVTLGSLLGDKLGGLKVQEEEEEEKLQSSDESAGEPSADSDPKD